MSCELNLALVQISKRAESVDPAKLVQTFVDVGPLFNLLKRNDHQIIYGRRGTGKTHALKYSIEEARQRGTLSVYIDLREVGSSGGIYADPNLPLSERATRLLLDVLGTVHDEFLAAAIGPMSLDLGIVGRLLDELGESITAVAVVGETTIKAKRSESQASSQEAGLFMQASHIPSLQLSDRNVRTGTHSADATVKDVGIKRHRVHFGAVSKSLKNLLAAVPSKRILIVLDEWSAVPLELQPYLADLLRRAVFPLLGFTVKIASIEQRSSFQLLREAGDYLGIEVGADAAADINLDDFMVFDNDAERSTAFFSQLLFRHFVADNPNSGITDAAQFIQSVFTQKNAFQEFVLASEGVPRDGINILSLAAQKALDEKISIPDVRIAARRWYQQGKEPSANSNASAGKLLHWIVDEVIAHRRARAFLLLSNSKHELIDLLFDARVLHIVKRGVSSNDQPGVRYHAYKLDYGCYVDLLTTAREPQGLLPSDEADSGYIDVPPDDYRAIRRAILNLKAFEDSLEGGSPQGAPEG